MSGTRREFGVRRGGRWAAAVVGALTALALAPAASAPAGAQQPPASSGTLSPEVLDQIDAILADKASRTPAEQKLDDSLLYASREQQGEEPVEGVPDLQSNAEVTGGLTEVDIDGEVTPELLQRIEALGGRVDVAIASADAIRARIPLAAIEPLSQDGTVERIRTADQATTNRIEQVANVIDGPVPNAGSVTSQADTTHAAATARASYGVDGTGIQIGVISDGATTIAARQASGDLPATVTVLPGQTGTGDEGTAMLELVHDLAPGAELFFATALGGQANFANNIRLLRDAGCDIIVDDISYFAEAVFQPGIVEQAVDDVVSTGVVYFSSAGNSGNLTDNTSGAWRGDWAPTGSDGGNPIYEVHDFSAAAGIQDQNQISNVNTTDGSVINLAWSDPLGGSNNDYDLFLLNSAGNAVFAASTGFQDGDDNPLEQVVATTNGQRVVIARLVTAAPRYLSVVTNRARFAPGGSFPLPASFATSGNGYGHNVGENTISVAATPVATAFGGGHPTGPFPAAHSAANVSERFSSDGPRRNFFETNGTPITPGNVSATGGEILNKPDITAGDGATTTTPGFIPFFGTSASAPHAAAIAALVLDADPTLTVSEVKTTLTSTAIDIEAPGIDNVTGSGIVMADAAVDTVAFAAGQFQFSALTSSIGEAGGAGTITVQRVGGADGAASVQVITNGGTATGGGVDYTYVSPQTLTWADGESTPKSVPVSIVNDTADELDETVAFALQNPTGATLGAPSTTALTIVDDDDSLGAGSVAMNVTSSNIAEGSGNAVITINRTAGTAATSVQLARVGGTATAGSDFTFTSPTTVNFALNQMVASVTVPIINNTTSEGPETIVFQLQNPAPGLTHSTALQGLTIVDDDPTRGAPALSVAQFNISTSTVTEGDSVNVQISRTGSLAGATVQVLHTGGTADAAEVAFTSPRTVSFATGQATATVNVATVEDLAVEPSETFQLTLQNPNGLAFGTTAVHTVTITDDDGPPPMLPGQVSFSSPTYSVSEAGGSVAVTVNRVGGSTGAASVQVAAVVGGTATGSGVDYTYTSPQTVSWSNGDAVPKTVTLTITNDIVAEGSETVLLALQNPTTVTIGNPSSTAVTIVDNDPAPGNPGSVSFGTTASGTTEGVPTAFITLVRGPGAGAATVQVARSGGTATPGSDFTFPTPVTVSFAVNQTSATVAVPIVNDSGLESSETVIFVLQSPSAGMSITAPTTHTLTIADNDRRGS